MQKLNEDQKLKVVESFDLTKNVREAKLVYATLGESFRTQATTPVKSAPKKAKTEKIKTNFGVSRLDAKTVPNKTPPATNRPNDFISLKSTASYCI